MRNYLETREAYRRHQLRKREWMSRMAGVTLVASIVILAIMIVAI